MRKKAGTKKLPKRADNGQITTLKFVKQHPEIGYLQTVPVRKKKAGAK